MSVTIPVPVIVAAITTGAIAVWYIRNSELHNEMSLPAFLALVAIVCFWAGWFAHGWSR